MKLVSYLKNGCSSFGIFTDDGIIDVPLHWSDGPADLLDLLRYGPGAFDQLEEILSHSAERISPNEIELVAPIVRPGKIIALAGNYSEHIKEAGLSLGLSESSRHDTVPRPFLIPATAVIGPGGTIPWPVFSRQIDYEIELAVVIARPAKCVQPEQALDYIAGYTIANDISARSVTFSKNRRSRPWDEFFDWMCGKWADGFLPMGPYLVTKDEIADVQQLDMELTVNGQVRQRANTSQMIYPVSEIVSFISHLMSLEPGDCIATGTPAGVALATGEYLKAGDIIRCTIESLGTLENTLGPPPQQYYEPLA